jgi:hypothetical protein
MLDYQKSLQAAFKEAATEEPVYQSVKSVFESSTREVVNAFLFKGEAPLPAGIEGDPSFASVFQKGALRAPNGASLKELLLKDRLFKHRCSYLVYSEFFLELPLPLKRAIYERLTQALQPGNIDAAYAYLGEQEKTAIREILQHTHPELRQFWQEKKAAGGNPTAG